MKLYFAYGANLSLDSMSYRCPKARPVTQFFLRDWRLELYNHATIQPSLGDQVPGALWLITEECEQHLDWFEGYPVYYQKQTITQDDFTFMVYTMQEPVSGSPSSGYISLLEQGYQDWRLPKFHLTHAQSQKPITAF
jgi:gamma-glutamylcyclotransferase (GGCT)/AIG2-like uncharacterized protein YtfP